MLIYILFFAIDLILIYKPVPIVAFPSMIMFLYVGITEFISLSDVDIPLNPITSVVFIIFVALGILRNGMEFKTK